MKIGILTTVHIKDQAALGLLRLLVDSVRQHVARTSYDAFVIADDCSPAEPATEAYYSWLESSGTATVYRMGPPRTPYWAPKHGTVPDGTPLSHGHAMGLMAGFWKLREMGCSHAWIIDGDCVVLRDPLRETVALAEKTGAAVVTDYFGGNPSDSTQVVDAEYLHFLADDGSVKKSVPKALFPCHAAWAIYGFPVLFCGLVDLEKEYRYGAFRNAGWVNNKWGYRLFRAGERVAYYPFFQNRSVFHLGLGYSKVNLDLKGQTLGNAKETATYGAKERGSHHAGFLQLDRPTEEHIKWLRWAATAPLSQNIQYDPKWFIDPPRTQLATREDTFLRPLLDSDLATLCSIDSDSEVTRFMQWGPHGEQYTRAFLERAKGTRWQWFALSNDKNEMLAYGEIRPQPDHGPHAVGLTYIVPRKHWKKGHGARLLHLLVEAAYNQLDCGTIFVRIDADHTASHGVLARAPYRGDWTHVGVEDYLLKGQLRKRNIYRRDLPINPGPPAATPEEALAEREKMLFTDLGIWR